MIFNIPYTWIGFYFNFGISVLGLVLESIKKDSFTNIMNSYINELGLLNTKVAYQKGNLDNYWKWKDNDGYIPAGAIISNIEDMAKYLNIYLKQENDYVLNTYKKLKTVGIKNAT